MPIFLNHNLNFKKSNLNSFRAFLLSIFIYISIFYIFNLSPSTLVHTTKFWFILSNTLIFIIAADSRTFDDNNVRPEAATQDLPYFQTKHHKTTTSSKHHAQLLVHDDQQPPEKIIGVVVAAADPIESQNALQKQRRRKNEAEKTDDKKKKEEITAEGNERILEEDDEFSRMSDEEVNRRVEEFILRFNRQIRVQAAMNRRRADN